MCNSSVWHTPGQWPYATPKPAMVGNAMTAMVGLLDNYVVELNFRAIQVLQAQNLLYHVTKLC